MAHKFSKLRDPLMADPVNRIRVETITRAMRDALEFTQLRENRDASYTGNRRIEHEEDLYLSTLSAYVAEMGGRLELRAVFPDETVEVVPAATTSAVDQTATARTA
jgi:hypothetical protein